MLSQLCSCALVALALVNAALGAAPAHAQVSLQPSFADRFMQASGRATTGVDEDFDFAYETSQEPGVFDREVHTPVATSGASALGAATQLSFQDSARIHVEGTMAAEAVNADGASFAEAVSINEYSMHFTTDATTKRRTP